MRDTNSTESLMTGFHSFLYEYLLRFYDFASFGDIRTVSIGRCSKEKVIMCTEEVIIRSKR